HVTESFDVTSADGTKTAVTVTITGTNDAPVVTAATAETDENTVLTSAVPNARDVDGTIASYQLVEKPAVGKLDFNADGSYTFTPDNAFADLADGQSREVSFTYTATDNNGAVSAPETVTITVHGKNN